MQSAGVAFEGGGGLQGQVPVPHTGAFHVCDIDAGWLCLLAFIFDWIFSSIISFIVFTLVSKIIYFQIIDFLFNPTTFSPVVGGGLSAGRLVS